MVENKGPEKSRREQDGSDVSGVSVNESEANNPENQDTEGHLRETNNSEVDSNNETHTATHSPAENIVQMMGKDDSSEVEVDAEEISEPEETTR